MGSGACPIISEFRDLGDGIMKEDIKKTTLATGILGANAVALNSSSAAKCFSTA